MIDACIHLATIDDLHMQFNYKHNTCTILSVQGKVQPHEYSQIQIHTVVHGDIKKRGLSTKFKDLLLTYVYLYKQHLANSHLCLYCVGYQHFQCICLAIAVLYNPNRPKIK